MEQDLKEKYKEYREALLKECQWLNSSIYLFRRIIDRKEDMPRAYKIAPHFFGMVLHSLESNIIISSFKLFDRCGQRGFFNYLRFIESNIPLFSKLYMGRSISKEVIELDRKSILELEALENIKTRRDKIHTHLDKKYFTDRDKLHDETPIKWEDFGKIQKLMDEILVKYSVAFDGNQYSIDFVNMNDVDRIFKEIQNNQKD